MCLNNCFESIYILLFYVQNFVFDTILKLHFRNRFKKSSFVPALQEPSQKPVLPVRPSTMVDKSAWFHPSKSIESWVKMIQQQQQLLTQQLTPPPQRPAANAVPAAAPAAASASGTANSLVIGNSLMSSTQGLTPLLQSDWVQIQLLPPACQETPPPSATDVQ